MSREDEARAVLPDALRRAYHGRRILPDWSTLDRWDRGAWLQAADVAVAYADRRVAEERERCARVAHLFAIEAFDTLGTTTDGTIARAAVQGNVAAGVAIAAAIRADASGEEG